MKPLKITSGIVKNKLCHTKYCRLGSGTNEETMDDFKQGNKANKGLDWRQGKEL